jgi:hypothetical protein
MLRKTLLVCRILSSVLYVAMDVFIAVHGRAAAPPRKLSASCPRSASDEIIRVLAAAFYTVWPTNTYFLESHDPGAEEYKVRSALPQHTVPLSQHPLYANDGSPAASCAIAT